MRRALALLLLAAAAAGCGAQPGTESTQTATEHARTATAPLLRIGVVGTVAVSVPGVVVDRGTLAQVIVDPLVLVAAGSPAAASLPAVAAANPQTHFALVGGSERTLHLHNVLGIVLRDDQAARLAGEVAGLVAQGEGVQQPRVGWVGAPGSTLANAFATGVHATARSAVVLHAWTADVPAECKESALELVARAAVAVVAERGLCADAAAAGAHEQSVVALQLPDFELPGVAAAAVVRDALAGVYHGGEDLVFGAASGAVGVGRLDPRIDAATVLRARTLAADLAAGR